VLARKLLNQGILVVNIFTSKALYGRHHDLVNRYEISVSQMGLSLSQFVLFSFMTYHRVCNKSNTRSATYGTGTAYLSLFVLLYFFFWSLYMHCLSLRDLWLLITPNTVSVLAQTTKQNHIHHVLFYFTP